MTTKRQRHDQPEPGKVYALTGGSNTPSIARGDSWQDSEVSIFDRFEEQRAEVISDHEAGEVTGS